jgi:predicted deacetylase
VSAKYLIRFDDLCPTMDWRVWDRIEQILVDTSVSPILAVVPDNRDSKLRVAQEYAGFWSRVREWQRRGWTIGLHGFQHLYVTRKSGLVGLNARSEFAGVPAEQQREKLDRALAIFSANDVLADVWIAPGHSFDDDTVSALYERGMRAISDGFFCNPVFWKNMIWIPQQLWRFRKFPGGVWTVCYHHNSFTEGDIDSFRRNIRAFRQQLVSFPSAATLARPLRGVDRLFARSWLMGLKMRRVLSVR